MPETRVELLCGTCASPITLACRAGSETLRCPGCAQKYEWDAGILLSGDAGGQEDYPDEVYGLLAGIEPRHFWFSGRNQVVRALLERVVGPLPGRSVLDIGCGTGFVLAALERAGMVGCGLDMHLAGLRYARQRTRGLLLRETAARVPFHEQFDTALLCDVIEHTPDDVAVLREASAALKPNGALLATVPADPRLWTALDEASGHKRRYTRGMLVAAMEQAGLQVCVVRYFNVLLYPAQMLQRWLVTRSADVRDAPRLDLFRRSFAPPPEPLNTLFRAAMYADLPLSHMPVPFGASLAAVGVRAQ